MEITGSESASADGIPSPVVSQGGPKLSLVSGNGTALPIIFPENPAPRTRQAAHYLADCIQEIGGIRRMSPGAGEEGNSRLTGLHPKTPMSKRMLRSIANSGLDLD